MSNDRAGSWVCIELLNDVGSVYRSTFSRLCFAAEDPDCRTRADGRSVTDWLSHLSGRCKRLTVLCRQHIGTEIRSIESTQNVRRTVNSYSAEIRSWRWQVTRN